MAVYRYLSFVESGDELPAKANLNLSFFLNEICGVEHELLKKAIRWSRKKKEWESDDMANAFYKNYLATSSHQEYIETMMCLNDLTPGFDNHLTEIVFDELNEMFENYQDQRMYKTLIRTATLFSEMYMLAMTSTEGFYGVLCSIVTTKMKIFRRIEVLKTLLTPEVVENLKIEHIDTRFLSLLSMMKSKAGSSEVPYTLKELMQVIRTLMQINFFPENALQHDKTEKLLNVIKNWCKGSSNLKKALTEFAALKLMYPEELSHCAHQMFVLAMQDIQKQEKLVMFQMHLKNDTYKDHPDLFNDAWSQMMTATIHGLFTDTTNASLTRNMTFVRYLSSMYNHGVLNNNLITRSLDCFVITAGCVSNPCFTAMFTSVEDKLKAEISEENFKVYTDHLVKEIIAGNENSPNLPNACMHWLAKVDKEKRAAAEKSKRQKAEAEIESEEEEKSDHFDFESIDTAVGNFCKGSHSLEQVMKTFAKFKSMTSHELSNFAHDMLAFAMLHIGNHEKLSILLKDLRNETFKQRSREFDNIFTEVLQCCVRDFFEDTVTPLTLERNMCFVSFLSYLFNQDVIGGELIVESLEIFMDDWGDTSDACFTSMFTSVDEKLETKISAEKFDEITQHFGGYILVNHSFGEMPLICKQWMEKQDKKPAEKAKKEKEKVPEKAPSVAPKLSAVEGMAQLMNQEAINLFNNPDITILGLSPLGQKHIEAAKAAAKICKQASNSSKVSSNGTKEEAKKVEVKAPAAAKTPKEMKSPLKVETAKSFTTEALKKVETKNESAPLQSSATAPKKKPRKIERMTINFQELDSEEKLNEVAENLQKVLNSEARIKTFIKHVLERPKSELQEILSQSKILVKLSETSSETFDFKNCLTATLNSEYLLTNAMRKFDKKAKAKLNRLEIISGELWRNNLMSTKKFAGLLLSKNIRYLPAESLAHLSSIVSGKTQTQTEGNSRLKLATRTFEPFIHGNVMKDCNEMKHDMDDLTDELQALLSYKEHFNKNH